MNVVVVSALLPPEGTGGTERVALEQARLLARRGHRVRLVTGRAAEHAGAAPLHETLGELEVLRLASDPGEVHAPLLRRPRRLAALVEAVGHPDVVLVQHLWNHELGLVRALADVAPVVLALHDFSAVCPRHFRTPEEPGLECPTADDLHARRLRACVTCVEDLAGGAGAGLREAWLAAHLDAWQAEVAGAARILVPSRTHLVRLLDLLDLGGRARILAPRPAAELVPVAVPRFDGDGPLRVLHPGRRSAHKGTLDLVRALAQLPAGRVVLVAPGGAEPGFDASLRAAAPDLAMELGEAYAPEDLGRVAATCHLAALPSRLPESYSLVLDECLALGLPVLGSAGCAARERFGPEALLELPAADPEAWAGALSEILEDPTLLDGMREALPGPEAFRGDGGARLEALLADAVAHGCAARAA